MAEFQKQSFFRSLAFGQISRDFRKAAELPIRISDCRDDRICPKPRAIFAHSPALVFKPPLGCRHAQSFLRFAALQVLCGVEAGKITTNDLFRSVSFDSLGTAIPS